MDLVTIADVTLHRIGSASGFGVAPRKEVHRITEVRDGSAQTLRELVLAIAEEHRDSRENLRSMTQVNAAVYATHQDAIVFNIQPSNIQYGTPYATCYTYPALKIGDRYFKLNEIYIS
jgi:hypothetical protein